jgi:hypothetical protein
MIEAMACGTPVIAWGQGSVPEVIDEGITGLMVFSIEEAVEAVRAASHMDRSAVRERFEARFTAARMASHYVETFEMLRHSKRTHRALLPRIPSVLPEPAGVGRGVTLRTMGRLSQAI